jgi:cytoskeletal protein CcmA (bactofilin family)
MDSVRQIGDAQRSLRPAVPLNGAGPAPVANGDGKIAEDLMSVIGHGIVVTGNIEAEVDLHIEGLVRGDVRCATLILGERSSVIGNVFAQRVRVSGNVEGGIETTDLAIEATARVKGDVSYSRLRIANGGIISGTMTHVPMEEEAADSGHLAQSAQPAEAPPKVHFIED